MRGGETIWVKAIISGHGSLRRRCAFDLATFSPYLHIIIIQRSKNGAFDRSTSFSDGNFSPCVRVCERAARVGSNGHLLEALNIRYGHIVALMS